MSSWRDNSSIQAQNDLDELLGKAIELAKQQLANHGEFFPYAVNIGVDGAAEIVAPRVEVTTEQPSSSDVIESCITALYDNRDHIRAAAVVADVRVPKLGGDAFQITLEHVEGPTLTVLLPYSMRSRACIQYGKLRASSGTRRIWRH